MRTNRLAARAAWHRSQSWADAYGSGTPHLAECDHCGTPINPYRSTQRWCARHSYAGHRDADTSTTKETAR